MSRSLRLLVLATASLLSLAAPAQVVRCTDARTGAVTYTDGDCNPGTRTREVQARQTPEEIAQERAQATQALTEKQQRLHIEAATQQLEAQRQAQRQREQAARAAAAQTPAQAYARSAECARSRRNFDMAASSAGGARYDQDARLQAAQRQMELDCLGPEGYAEVEKNRPAPLPAPIVVYPPPRWRPQPPYPRPPYPTAPPPRPPGFQSPPSFAPMPSFAPLPSFAPMPSLQSPPAGRRCNGRDCDESTGRRPTR